MFNLQNLGKYFFQTQKLRKSGKKSQSIDFLIRLKLPNKSFLTQSLKYFSSWSLCICWWHFKPCCQRFLQIIHTNALDLYNQIGLEQYLQFELKHKAIIDRFGRYPHRNAILGRSSTEEELEFLKTSV